MDLEQSGTYRQRPVSRPLMLRCGMISCVGGGHELLVDCRAILWLWSLLFHVFGSQCWARNLSYEFLNSLTNFDCLIERGSEFHTAKIFRRSSRDFRGSRARGSEERRVCAPSALCKRCGGINAGYPFERFKCLNTVSSYTTFFQGCEPNFL